MVFADDRAASPADEGADPPVETGAELVSDAAAIRAYLGPAVEAELTYPKIFLDSVESARPVLVKSAGQTTLVVNMSDSAPLASAGADRTILNYGDYFDWNRPADRPVRSFGEAVREAAGPGPIGVDPSLPFSRHAALAATGPVSVRPGGPDGPVGIYRKARSDIEWQWSATRESDAALVSSFVATLRRGDDLHRAMRLPPVGFEPLDRLLSEADLASFLVTSPFGAELVCGLPAEAAAQLGLSCLILPGRDDVTILARRPIGRADVLLIGEAPSLAAAVLAECGFRPVGVEEGHIGIGAVQRLQEAGCEPRAAVSVFRCWQDMRAGTDLPYFIVAANAVLAGIAHASRFIARHIGTGLTEAEANAAFDGGVSDFARSVGFAGRVERYFDIIHSGERTLLPAIAGEYPLLPEHRTIKFDMGVLVRDAFGCVRGCSDIARTLSPDPAIREAHDAVRAALVDDLIPAMRPGMTGAAIHALGQDALRRKEDVIARAGLMPAGTTMDGYSRDCGHTIHRTTAGSVYFMPGATGTIEPGMLGCVEYVWPVGDVIVAVEDGYYVTETGAIPFTI